MKRRLPGAIGLGLALVVLWGLLGSGWYATAGLERDWHWDEKYVFDNIRPVLQGDGLRPVNGWYPRLSYLPQAALLVASHKVGVATGNEKLLVITPDGHFTPTAYIISRWLNVLFGAGCLIVTFLIGRRMFSPEVGLVAALLQSLTPWQIRAAAVFKPDPLLLLFMSLAFYLSLLAIERRSLRSYLLCGVAIGLATSAKINGAFASIPLVALTLLEPRQRSRWLGLAMAGVTSIAVFFLINPYPLYYLDYAGRLNQSLVHHRAERSALSMLGETVEALGGWAFHGGFIGVVAALGLAGLIALLYRRWSKHRVRFELLLFFSYVVGYAVAFATLSNYWKGNYVLPLLPFSTLAAAWLLVALWQRTGGRLRNPSRWILLVATAILLIVIAGRMGWRYVHWGAVPATTLHEAGRVLKRYDVFFNHRIAVYESDVQGFEAERRPSPDERVIVVGVEEPSLVAVSTHELDLADYEIFARRRLEGRTAAFYRQRLERLDPGQIETIEGHWTTVRGKTQLLLMHPWNLVFPPLALEPIRDQKRRFIAKLPRQLRPNQAITLDLEFSGLTEGALLENACRLILDGEEHELFWYYAWEDRHFWMTKRLRLTEPKALVEVRCTKDSDHLKKLATVQVIRWRPGAG